MTIELFIIFALLALVWLLGAAIRQTKAAGDEQADYWRRKYYDLQNNRNRYDFEDKHGQEPH